MEQGFDRGFAHIRPGGDRGDLGGQAVRGLLADARQAVMVQFEDWRFEFQQNRLIAKVEEKIRNKRKITKQTKNLGFDIWDTEYFKQGEMSKIIEYSQFVTRSFKIVHDLRFMLCGQVGDR